ncbi:MAG: DUF58 domain-containing protein [Prevotellaceae bacterium]|jgi:hypothetical protein|nr:DUF58 domain-containing protein [Prevotellaceae bacterium]
MDLKLNIKQIRKKIPLRTVFFIILSIFILLKYFYPEASEKAIDIYTLLFKLLTVVISAIILFSISTILISYLPYIKRCEVPEVKFFYSSDNNVICKINLYKLCFPFAGIMKAELTFNARYDISIILKRKKGKQASGLKELFLPDIKNYDIENVTVYFQDFFRLFSLYKTFRFKSSVFILPVSKNEYKIENMAVNLDEDDVKTDTVHRKEGELIHFKHFESSDDIRRIVWSVYARSKELIVRTVEMMNMYASQIDVYASFSNKYINAIDRNVSDKFLNCYKTAIWEIYLSLKNKDEVSVNFIQDQKLKITADYRHGVQGLISGMEWHADSIVNCLHGNRVSICCISSLVDSKDIEKIVDTFSENTFVVFVTLKSIFGKIDANRVIREIFTISDSGKYWKWFFSNIRKRVKVNEAEIRNALKSRDLKYMEL